MTNWSTPRIGGSNESLESWLTRKQKEYDTYPGKGIGTPSVDVQAQMTNWPTSSATDHKGGYQGGRIRNGKLSVDRLDVAAQLVMPDYPIRITLDGMMLTGSIAAMNGSGPLSPEHSRWLMGFPGVWGYSKDMVTPSYLRSQPGSSVTLSSQLVRLAEALFRNRLAREALNEQNLR